MAVYRRSRRQRFALVVLILTSITVVTLDFRGDGAVGSLRSGLRDVFAPAQAVVARVFSPVTGAFGGISRYRGLRSENERLRRELDTAKAEALKGADASRERRLLLALGGLDFAGEIRSIPARVVGYAPSNFAVTIEINKGIGHRLAVGMPVVTEAGLVGRITEASWDRSTVLLLTDPASAVGVRLATSGEVGVVKGAGQRRLLPLDLIPVEAELKPGDAVVTSGLDGGLFPPAVPVGRVVMAKVEPGALAQEATIEPTVDFARLELVKVLLWTPRP